MTLRKAHSYGHTFTPGQVRLPEQKSAIILSHKHFLPAERERERGRQGKRVAQYTDAHIRTYMHTHTRSLSPSNSFAFAHSVISHM